MAEDQDNIETPKIMSGGDELITNDDLLDEISKIEAPEEFQKQFMELFNEQSRRKLEITQRLKTILDTVVEGILIVDAAGIIQDFNKSAEEILRAQSGELLGTSVDVMFIDRKMTVRHRLLNRCINISSGVLKYDYTETMAQRLDGDSFPMEIIVSPANFSSEMSYLYIFRDITRRRQAEDAQKKLEEDLREALKLEAIGHLAGGIAHEINTPSQYIRDNLKFLNDSYGALSRVLGLSLQTLWKNRAFLPDNTFEEFAKQLRNSDMEFLLEEIPHATQQSLDGINQVARIVLSMKEFSHPGGTEKTTTDINRVLSNVIVISRNEWKHYADVVEKFDPEIPHIPCYINEVNQVFLNLIVNAVQAIQEAGRKPSEGEIVVKTTSLDDSILISISDNGTGIDKENRSKIFNPFFTTKEVGKGTGQGLSITHDIVTVRHGGRIWFETQVGKGTTFHVLLPGEDRTGKSASE
ncbi:MULTISPECIES: ATP-binding protein [Thalassospira]|uniref:histidine kinase n=3 Tax=Thalassospira TaxID=168934 RepID=A0A8I1M637_9PROT|nr:MULTISPECIES: ATP-binding protein [Thalassospira]MEE3044177.1 ATP-binding protein [Pseudomonadota bacterium]RCK26513.1 histidine kinase [Thalassospira profundimaris]MBN8195659.1 PAS domain S-box protein [Thalassospira povalilytica]MBO6770001.1 PAS domain S-box protein [Thalassospira sp.]MCC4239535.1 PAS domain S-box protein [Thalassospira povalilytica]|tara:strand:+ start:1700 stop:3100 length:1401 start_codon:yes stop_codon:yes gene_type:complete